MKLLTIVLATLVLAGCGVPVQSTSGVKMKTVGSIEIDEYGYSAEQNSIAKKIKIEADSEKIWYIYVLSPYDHQVILKSSAKGKITSSNKRLTPSLIDDSSVGMSFNIGDQIYYTNEVPSEDGTFGHSAEYIYWTDTEGRNRRHYLLGGQIIHVVDEEMATSQLLWRTGNEHER